MAKDLPYFKFIVNEWITGDITLEDLNIQGLFINLCAWYWSKECTLSLENAKKKFSNCKAITFEKLENSAAIKVNEQGFIIINFLDEQFQEFREISEKRSSIGKLGGRGNKAIVKQKESNCFIESKLNKAKREEEKKEEKNRREEIEIIFPFVSENFKKMWSNWIDYKKQQFNFTYKSAISEQGALKDLSKLSDGNEYMAIELIENAISKAWKGIYKPDNFKSNGTGQQNAIGETATDRAYQRAAQAFANSKSNQ